jgi:UDP-glucuronate 4-epimerase
MDMIAALESSLGVTARKIMKPMQPGDVPATYADISKLNARIGFKPAIMLEDGLDRFAAWWRGFYSDRAA